MNWQRAANYARYLATMGGDRISYVPPVFDAFISAACNLRCPTCLFRLKDRAVFDHQSFMPLRTLKHVLDKYGQITTLWLSGGEPLLHPQFDEVVRTARGRYVTVRVTTNGLRIKEHIATLASVGQVNVSLDGHDYQSFAAVRGGTAGQFETIIENLRLLKQAAIPFTLTFLLSGENAADIPVMLSAATRMGPRAVVFHNVNPHGAGEYRPLTTDMPGLEELFFRVMRRTDYPFDIVLPTVFDLRSRRFAEKRCNQPWGYCFFDGQGDIAYCCHLRHDRQIGNMLDAYDFNSPAMVRFRGRMSEADYPADCLYCERRFAGQEYARFSRASQKWRRAR